MTPPPESIDRLALARSYVAAGFSVVPVSMDGMKRPALAEWRTYMKRKPSDAELAEWFPRHRALGLVMGAVSGNAETLDIDDPDLVDPWRSLIQETAPGLLERLTEIETPRGGRHYIYRSEAIEGGRKLAISETRQTLIETRGEGNQVVAVGSDPNCHAAKQPYRHVGGPAVTEVPTITREEREVLIRAARSFNRCLGDGGHVVDGGREQALHRADGDGAPDDLLPGDDFIQRAKWTEILERAGWSVALARDGRTYWRRPGKDTPGWSATTGHCDRGDLFYVFSSNAHPFEPEKGYTKFAAFTLLNHGGDYKAAAKALVRIGYGSRRRAAEAAPLHEADSHDQYTLGAILKDKKTWEPVRKISTGIAGLDRILGGGLRVGGVTLITGKSGRAKTQTAIQICANVAAAGNPVAVFSLEMTRHDVAQLLIAQYSTVSRKWISEGKVRPSQKERLKAAVEEASGWPLIVLDDDAWPGGLNRSRLAYLVQHLKRQRGSKLIALDYIGLLAKEKSDTSDYCADVENSTALKRIARTNDAALIVIAPLRKAAMFKRKESPLDPPSLEDVLGAGRLVYDAENVLYIDCQQERVERGPPVGEVFIHPLKTRFSGAGSSNEVLSLKWLPACGQIKDDVMNWQGEDEEDEGDDGEAPPF